ncbi:hypothetical protein AC249_AIPGENE27535 [Exaiptasia diaphana]|nr:hypothetical protein AC249_AIPGENE27535 [Exaiptasia diaphana]
MDNEVRKAIRLLKQKKKAVIGIEAGRPHGRKNEPQAAMEGDAVEMSVNANSGNQGFLSELKAKDDCVLILLIMSIC